MPRAWKRLFLKDLCVVERIPGGDLAVYLAALNVAQSCCEHALLHGRSIAAFGKHEAGCSPIVIGQRGVERRGRDVATAVIAGTVFACGEANSGRPGNCCRPKRAERDPLAAGSGSALRRGGGQDDRGG